MATARRLFSWLGFGSMLLLGAALASATETKPLRVGDDASHLALDAALWQPAPADALPRHRARPGFLAAALAEPDGERLGALVVQRVPWEALGTATDPGYDATSLERFVFESAEAVASQPGVELVASGLLARDDEAHLPVGRLELLRDDAGLRDELALALPPSDARIRQLTLSIATAEGLVQIFAYMPADALVVRDALLLAAARQLEAEPREQPASATGPRQERDLWPILLGVAAAALALLVGVRLYLVLRRRSLRGDAGRELAERGTTAPGAAGADTPRAPWEDEL